MNYLRVGKIDVYLLEDASFRLDGGAMFGVVPKVIWRRLSDADEMNRIPLLVRPMLLRADGKWILVETGMDDKQGEKHRKIYGITAAGKMLSQLAELGLEPKDIDVVVNTHLHFDHAGMNTMSRDGSIVPMFTNAQYLVQKQELYDAQHPHERNKASYLPENIAPIAEAGLFVEIEGEAEIAEGVKLLPLPGHTLGQQGVVIESEGQTAVYTADMVPTLEHVPLPYIMAYDLYPVTTLEARKEHYQRWLEKGALLITPHDPLNPLGRIAHGERGYYAEAVRL